MSLSTITKFAACGMLALTVGFVSGCKEESVTEQKMENAAARKEQAGDNKAEEVRAEADKAKAAAENKADEIEKKADDAGAELKKEADKLPEAAH